MRRPYSFEGTRLRHELKARLWKLRGSRPDAAGSAAAKWLAIEQGILAAGRAPFAYDAAGLDERVVEYPWIFERLGTLDQPAGRILDAGSVMNQKRILAHWRRLGRSPLSIVTLRYEGAAQVSDIARYEFADLRELPYRDEWFSHVICASTLEHVGMDTSIYGAVVRKSGDPTVESSRAVRELLRVTRNGGTLLISVPFGRRSDRGWLRVFDGDDLERLIARSGWTHQRSRFYRATSAGWRECGQEDARDAGYNEPARRGGQHSAPACVAAAEAVALVELVKRENA